MPVFSPRRRPRRRTSLDATPLIGAAYDAALEPSRWNDFAQALSDVCGGAPLLLALRAPRQRHRGDVVVAGIEEHHRDAYRDGDWSADPLIADDLQLPSGAVLFRHEHLLAEAPADREFSRRWLAPQDIRPEPTISGLILADADGPSAYLHLFSRRGAPALGDSGMRWCAVSCRTSSAPLWSCVKRRRCASSATRRSSVSKRIAVQF
jgi:hypothetical protein